MNLSLIRSMTRSAVFELENGKCFRPEHPFAVALNGKTIYESCNTNVFSLFSLTPSTTYTVEVDAEGEHLKLDFTTEAESFFVDASRYGLVADGETDNTGRLQAALSTCPRGGTVYVPAGRYRTASLFMKSCTTLYLEILRWRRSSALNCSSSAIGTSWSRVFFPISVFCTMASSILRLSFFWFSIQKSPF